VLRCGLVCGGGAVAGPFALTAIAQAAPATEAADPDAAAWPRELADVLGLPVVEVPATESARGTLAVLLTGDGGWAAGDKAIAAELAARGVAVVGLDIPSYLGVARTPDGAAADLGRLLEHYLDAWHKDRVILVGYSHGADVAPFMAPRLPDELRGRIDLLALLGPADRASFRFHLADILANLQHDGDLARVTTHGGGHVVSRKAARAVEQAIVTALAPPAITSPRPPGARR
jgi:type IV secretory pathway VirJ component